MRRILSLLLLAAMLAACSGTPQPQATPQPGGTPTSVAQQNGTDSTAQPTPAATPGQDGPTPAGDDEHATISFAVWDYERQLYEPLVQKFTAEHPDINVALVPLDDLTAPTGTEADFSPLAALRRIVSGADTMSASFVSPETIGSGLLLDLRPQMEADASFHADDFLPGALEQHSRQGVLWMLPRFVNVRLLSYNKELFKSAGLPQPQPGWTWNDLLGAAEQIGKKNGRQIESYGFLDSSNGSTPLFAMLQAQGIDLPTTPAQETQLDRPEIVAAAARVRAMVDSGAILRPLYKAEPSGGIDPAQLVRDGRVAIWSDDTVIAPCDGPACSQQAAGYSFPVGKVPYPSEVAPFFSGGDGFVVSSGTLHPAAAWQWIEFLSRQPIESAAGQGQPNGGANAPGRIPARQSLADELGFWKNVDEETAASFRWTIAHTAPAPDSVPDTTLYGVLSPALDQILGQPKADPQKILREAQKQLREQLAQIPSTPTPAPSAGPVVVATPEPQAAPEGATTVTFAASGDNPTILRQLARAFRDQRPDIFVQIKTAVSAAEPATFQQTAAASDCFAWYTPPQSDADLAGLLDLQPLFDADASFPQADYPPALLEPYRHNGRLYGLPYAATLRTLNYNKTAFDAAGIQLPSYRWTPDDFLAAAQALTSGEGENKRYGFMPLGGAIGELQFFVSQFGGRLTTGSGPDLRPDFTNPKTMAAIRWYLDLALVHKVMPVPQLTYRRDGPGYDDSSYQQIMQGHAGMWFHQGLLFGYVLDDPNPPKGDAPAPPSFEEAIAPLPVANSGLGSADAAVRGFHISAHTQQTQACWEWLKFLSGDVTNLYSGIPARISVIGSDAFMHGAQPDAVRMAATYADALRQAKGAAGQGEPLDLFVRMDPYWFFKALSEAIDGTSTLEKGLAEAQAYTSKYLECKAKQPEQAATCAQQADPTYKGFATDNLPPRS